MINPYETYYSYAPDPLPAADRNLLQAAAKVVTAFEAAKRLNDIAGDVNRWSYIVEYEAAIDTLRSAVQAKCGAV